MIKRPKGRNGDANRWQKVGKKFGTQDGNNTVDQALDKPLLIEELEPGQEPERTHPDVGTSVAPVDAALPKVEVGETSKQVGKDTKKQDSLGLQEVLVQYSIGVQKMFFEPRKGKSWNKYNSHTGNAIVKSKPLVRQVRCGRWGTRY